MIPLPALEGVIDASGAAPRIEDMLPAGARARQLSVRTLLLGMMLALGDGRPAHLTRVHQALVSLPGDDQRRLGVTAGWKDGPHRLTYRQAEYTFRLVTRALAKDGPDGLPSRDRQRACDDLEASIPEQFKDASSSLAVDWSDLESFSRPPPRGTSDCADPEASWGHRRNNLLHEQDELFFGYYLSDAIIVPDEQGRPVPELARRMSVSSCRNDPVPASTPVLTALPGHGVPLGDILAGSGYSHRIPQNWASPLRKAGAALIQDLHPHDRGPKGTHAGAVIANGNLYCPWAVPGAHSPCAGATVPGGQSPPSSPGIRPGCGRPRPACRAREYPRMPPESRRAPKPFRECVQTKVPSGLAASNVGHGRHRHPEVPCRCPVHRRQATSRSGASALAMYLHECRLPEGFTERDSIGEGESGALRHPGGRSRPLV